MSTVTEPQAPPTWAPLVKYSVTEAEIEDMKKTLVGLTAETPAKYQIVRDGIADCRDLRTAIERKRKELKEDSLKWGKLVDGEARRLTALILEIEEPLKLTKQAVDDEKERVKQEKAQAERLRIEAELKAKRDAEEAEAARIKAEKEVAEKAERERIAAEQKAESERLAAERAKLAAEQAEADRKRAEAEAEMKRQQAIIDEQNRIAQAKIDEQAAIVKAEREKLAREQFEKEARERAEADARAKAEAEVAAAKRRAEEAEAARIREEAQRPDREKLAGFATKLIHMQFPEVKTEEAAAVLKSVDDIFTRAAKIIQDYCDS